MHTKALVLMLDFTSRRLRRICPAKSPLEEAFAPFAGGGSEQI